MANKIRILNNLKSVTRVEFIPANSASVIIGFAWAIGLSYPFTLSSVGFLLALFVVLSSIGTIGAHWNTYSDFELDRDDPTKRELHRSLLELGRGTLLKIIRVEVVLSTTIFLVFWFFHQNMALLAIWLIAISLASAYSMPPLRFKARGILAFASLCLVLSILPVLFVYLSTNPVLASDFLFFLAGHTMVIYSLIVPTEIRDYRVDRDHHVNTMAVWLGLKKAILLALILISVGTVLIVTSYFSCYLFSRYPLLRVALLVPLACNGWVLSRFLLLRKCILSEKKIDDDTKSRVNQLAADNPKWITISSMGSLFVSLVTMIGKILFV